MLFWRPLKELDCCYEARLKPPALFHIFCGQPFTPPSFLGFGQVLKMGNSHAQARESDRVAPASLPVRIRF